MGVQIPFSYMPFQMGGFPQFPQFYQPMGVAPSPILNPQPVAIQTPPPAAIPEVVVSQPKILDSSKFIEESEDIEESERILIPDNPKERWKREDDKKMFQFLRNHCTKYNKGLDSIYKDLTNNTPDQLSFWGKMACKLNWKGPVTMLQQRFLKLYCKKTLSVREENLFFKLIAKKDKSGTIPWEAILYHFPGKTVEDLKHK